MYWLGHRIPLLNSQWQLQRLVPGRLGGWEPWEASTQPTSPDQRSGDSVNARWLFKREIKFSLLHRARSRTVYNLLLSLLERSLISRQLYKWISVVLLIINS
jgi:hypothetical protein